MSRSPSPLNFSITSPERSIIGALQNAINNKTKPLGSLGRIERLAVQIGCIQQSTTPMLSKPHILVVAADHGIAEEGVSAYPQEVTAQMVVNYLSGGAAINVFARNNGLSVMIVDAGVKGHIPVPTHLLGELMHAKVAHGTRNFAREAAMSLDEALKALETGATIVRDLHSDGVNCIGFGEMGIGNTSAAAALMAALCDEPMEMCVGRGTGLDDEKFHHKIEVLRDALEFHRPFITQPLDALARVGGFEIAMICGAALQAAELRMVILVDGFIASAAILLASKLFPAMLDYCVFSHISDEAGHALMLRHLGAEPLLSLSLRLGEGTGAALAYPLVQAAVAMLNEMATFSSAGVSGTVES
jgi:nicotinate-nucleotide--dimethylbenzimidazole phosphoribosyltransferase